MRLYLILLIELEINTTKKAKFTHINMITSFRKIQGSNTCQI